jgi:phage-related protein
MMDKKAGVVRKPLFWLGGTRRAVYALHAFQKKSTQGRKTPKHEIDLIKTRLRQAEEQYAQWNASKKEDVSARDD